MTHAVRQRSFLTGTEWPVIGFEYEKSFQIILSPVAPTQLEQEFVSETVPINPRDTLVNMATPFEAGNVNEDGCDTRAAACQEVLGNIHRILFPRIGNNFD